MTMMRSVIAAAIGTLFAGAAFAQSANSTTSTTPASSTSGTQSVVTQGGDSAGQHDFNRQRRSADNSTTSTTSTTSVAPGGSTAPSANPSQRSGDFAQRDLNQQRRIEQGLKSGQLTTQEAARLERGEARIDKMESRALADGNLSPQERQRIQRAQNQEGRQIARDMNNGRTGDPNSASSRRMQGDVQRNIDQQRRIDQGMRSGQLNNREVSRLERGESRINRMEARAGANSHVNPGAQQRVQYAQNHESRQIHNERHDFRATSYTRNNRVGRR